MNSYVTKLEISWDLDLRLYLIARNYSWKLVKFPWFGVPLLCTVQGEGHCLAQLADNRFRYKTKRRNYY